MKNRFCLIAIFIINSTIGLCQSLQKEVKLSPIQLQEDLTFLKHLINDVHVNPNWELSPQQFNKLFAHIEANLKDSATATDFLKLVKPVIAHLSDEHSQIYLKPILQSETFQKDAIYPPFSLAKVGNNYIINDVLEKTTLLNKGERILQINNIPIETWVQNCSLDTIGFPNQRIEIALKQFGYMFPWASTIESSTFIIKTGKGKFLNVKGTTLNVWRNFISKHNQGQSSNCAERLSYIRFGNTGYINACNFDVQSKGINSIDSIKHKIDVIFNQINEDKIQKLIIDVSKNGGGNSAVGQYLISSFYDKPYKDYQVDFKKSTEYLKLYESWGFHNPDYAAALDGKILHSPSVMILPENVPFRFKGKVIIVMGPPTFSSAMTFVTLIKDNQIATIIGQPSLNGHPTGLGEQFYIYLPNSKIFVRLSVKEFIRPAGNAKDNILHPDVVLKNNELFNVNELVKIAASYN